MVLVYSQTVWAHLLRVVPSAPTAVCRELSLERQNLRFGPPKELTTQLSPAFIDPVNGLIRTYRQLRSNPGPK